MRIDATGFITITIYHRTLTMKSKIDSHLGYLMIDHRNSPGVTKEEIAKSGTPCAAVPGGVLFEADTYQCPHCQRIIIKNPLRTRPRKVCNKCMNVVCDQCAPNECVPFAKIIEDVLESAIKRIQRGMQRIGW